MPVSIYPWDLRAWKTAFRTARLPGFALLALLLGTILQTQDITGAGGGAGHTSPTIILLVRLPLTLLALLFLLVQPRFSRVSIGDTRFLFLLFAMLYLASTLWSAHPIVTLGKSVEIILAALVFLEASRSANPLKKIDALLQIILLTVSLVALVTVAGFVLHLTGFHQDRPGIFTSTTAMAPFLSGNGLGYVTSAMFLVILAEWQAGRIKQRAAFRQMGFALALFSVAASRTSFVIILLSIILIVYRRSRAAAVICSVVVVFAIAMFRVALLDTLQGRESEGGFQTLSGRTVAWTAAFDQFRQHPFLGAGGGVGGKIVIENLNDVYLEKMSSLHNGFMELLVGLGAIGLVLGASMLIIATWRAWKAWRTYPEYSGIYVLIVHAWLTTIMSTGVLGWMGYEMAFFLCILTNLDLVQRHAVTDASPSAPYAKLREPRFSVALD